MTLLQWLEVGIMLQAPAEVTWAALWYTALVKPNISLLATALFLLGVVLLSEQGSRWLKRRQTWSPTRRLLASVGLLALVIGGSWWLGIRSSPENAMSAPAFATILSLNASLFWHIAILLLLAWRGIRLGRFYVDSDEALGSLRFGLLAFLIYGIFSGTAPTLSALAPVLAFLALSLSSIGILKMVDLFQARGGRLPTTPTTWWFFIVIAAFALSFLGTIIGVFLEQPAEWLSWGLMILVAIPMIVVAFIFGAVVLIILTWLIPLLAPGTAPTLPSTLNPDRLPETVRQLLQGLEPTTQWSFLDRLAPILALLALIGLIVLVLTELRSPALTLLYALRESGEEGRIHLERLTSRLTRARQQRRWRSHLERQRIANRIRAIYQALLDLAQALGQPRPPALTPLEFLPMLQILFPEQGTALRVLTQAYVKVRYGEIPEDPAELAQVEDAWKHIEAEGQKRLQELRAREHNRKRSRQ